MTSYLLNQCWLRWLMPHGDKRPEAITWANVDPDLCLHIASKGHNELTCICLKERICILHEFHCLFVVLQSISHQYVPGVDIIKVPVLLKQPMNSDLKIIQTHSSSYLIVLKYLTIACLKTILKWSFDLSILIHWLKLKALSPFMFQSACMSSTKIEKKNAIGADNLMFLLYNTHKILTHLSLDKMAAKLKRINLSGISSIKIGQYLYIFTAICAQGCDWREATIALDNGLVPNRHQAII